MNSLIYLVSPLFCVAAFGARIVIVALSRNVVAVICRFVGVSVAFAHFHEDGLMDSRRRRRKRR